MIKLIVSDFSRTILFPKDTNYLASLNNLYKSLTPNSAGFWDVFYLNESYMKTLAGIEIPKIIFTTGYLQEDPQIKPKLLRVFGEIFNCDTIGGLKKDNPLAYLKICELTNNIPEETLFIDDEPVNISAAEQAGLKTLGFINSDLFYEQLKLIIENN